MQIGYVRVNTHDQNVDLQIDALTKGGCEMIFKEKISGKSKDRPKLGKLYEKLGISDTFIV